MSKRMGNNWCTDRIGTNLNRDMHHPVRIGGLRLSRLLLCSDGTKKDGDRTTTCVAWSLSKSVRFRIPSSSLVPPSNSETPIVEWIVLVILWHCFTTPVAFMKQLGFGNNHKPIIHKLVPKNIEKPAIFFQICTRHDCWQMIRKWFAAFTENMMSWWLDQPRIKAIAKNQVFGQSGGQMVTVGALPSTIWLPWLVDVYIMLYIIWFIILIGDCHHPRTGNPVPHRLKGFTMSPGTPLLVQQLLHDGLKPIQLQISSLYMRIYIYTYYIVWYATICILYTVYCIRTYV
jgi:hypothetical protein